jgi:hypothetical protein
VLCREEASLAYVRAVNPHITSALVHDMAFHIDAHSLLARTDLARQGLPVLEAALGSAGQTLAAIAAKPRVRFMRGDKERTETSTDSHIDLSVVLGNVTSVANAEIVSWCFLKIVSTARYIETDRLHVAIAAALCSVRCDLYDNAYGKNHAVFAASLSRFPNIRFFSGSNQSSDWGRPTREERAASLRKSLRPRRIIKRIGLLTGRLDGMIARAGLPSL